MPWRHDEQEEIPAPCWLITLHFAMQKQWDCSKTTARYRKKISYIIERTRLFCVLKCSGGPTLFKLLLGVTVNKNKVAPTVLGKIIDQAFTYLHGSFVKSHHVFCQYVNGDECLSSFLAYRKCTVYSFAVFTFLLSLHPATYDCTVALSRCTTCRKLRSGYWGSGQ
jgi:hypothetical protein